MRFAVSSSNDDGKVKCEVITPTIKIDGITKIPCITCKNRTNHKKLFEKEFDYPYEDGDSYFTSSLCELFECLGCDSITFKQTYLDSEEWEKIDETHGKVDMGHFQYFPKRTSRMILSKHFWGIPSTIRTIYEETINSYNEELRILCAIGIRSIIEAMCLEEGISANDLKDKINLLVSSGVVTSKIGEGLHESRLLGNEGAHELTIFDDKELRAGIRLIESVIESHYLSPEQIELIKKRKKSSV